MEIKQQYLSYLNALDRDACVSLITSSLDEHKIDLFSVYSDILTHALDEVENVDHNVWEEHIKTQIVRTTLESLYPYVLKQGPKEKNAKIAVVCPEGEYHELGGRLVSDYFRLLGFEVYYLGNSLPKHELIDLIRECKLNALAISVANFYTISALNAMIKLVNEANPTLSIILGGRAVEHNSKGIHGNNLLFCKTYDDILKAAQAVTV
jgi:methanogenic corrinoid protein MtbC1